MNATPAYDFLDRPARPAKPRTRGLTVVSDKAKSLAQAKDIMETAGDVIDHIKMPDHVGVMWRYSAAAIRSQTCILTGNEGRHRIAFDDGKDEAHANRRLQ